MIFKMDESINMFIKRTPSSFDSTPLSALPLAMAYVPMQPFGQVYSDSAALDSGTLFPCLDKPFLGSRRWGK